jgi:6-phosphogluconolactonase
MSEPIWAEDGSDRAVADHIAARIAAGARRLALPGGRTPAPILDDLAERPLPWAQIAVLPTDERVVPPGHAAENRGAIAAGLAGTGAPVLPLREDWRPHSFDLVWIGMGDDGHIASIFPSMDIQVAGRPAVLRATPDPLPSEAPYARLTLNYAALADTSDLIVVARGAQKRRLLEAAMVGGNDLPIARMLKRARCPMRIFWSE